MSEVIEPVVKARNKRHDVHLYVITRVKVCNVKAPTPAMAAAKAEDMVMEHLHDILDGHVMHSLDSDAYVEHTEYAEDGCKYFCVDPYKGKEIDYASVQWLDILPILKGGEDVKSSPRCARQPNNHRLSGALSVSSDPLVISCQDDTAWVKQAARGARPPERQLAKPSDKLPAAGSLSFPQLSNKEQV